MKNLSLFITALLGFVTANVAAAKPNFLFIYTDDQRWDAMSCVQKNIATESASSQDKKGLKRR